MEKKVIDGFKYYYFDTVQEYLDNYDAIEKKIWFSINHKYRLRNATIKDIAKETNTNKGLEDFYFTLESKDGKKIDGVAQLVSKPCEMELIPAGYCLMMVPGAVQWRTALKKDVLEAKVGDIVTIGGDFEELRHQKIVPLRYFKKE